MENNEVLEEQKITLDGKVVTSQELREAQSNNAVRIIEDKNNKGEYRTLKRLKG